MWSIGYWNNNTKRERDRRERWLLFNNSEDVVYKTLHGEWLGWEFENNGCDAPKPNRNIERKRIDSIPFFVALRGKLRRRVKSVRALNCHCLRFHVALWLWLCDSSPSVLTVGSERRLFYALHFPPMQDIVSLHVA